MQFVWSDFCGKRRMAFSEKILQREENTEWLKL